MGSSSKWVLWKPIRFRRQSSIMACLNPLCLQQASAGFPESFWITAQHIDKQYHRYRGLTSLCMTNDRRSVGATVGFSFQLVFTNGFQLEALHIRNLYSPPILWRHRNREGPENWELWLDSWGDSTKIRILIHWPLERIKPMPNSLFAITPIPSHCQGNWKWRWKETRFSN